MEIEAIRATIEVGDLGAALPFLRDVIGLEVVVADGEPPTFAILGSAPADIGVVQVDGPAIPQGAACYVTVRGIDELVARLAAAGTPLVEPLTERPWGLRDLVVEVPGRGPRIAVGERT